MRLARWLLTKCIAADRRDAIIGDLDESYASGRSDAWYWKEALIVAIHEMARFIALPMLIGIAGAAAQIAIVQLITGAGPLFMLPYPVVILASVLFARRRYPNAFVPRFSTVVIAWASMNLLFYFAFAFVITPYGVANIPLLGHLWRIGALLAIGVVAAAAISFRWTGHPRTFTLSLGALGCGALFVLGYAGRFALIATLSAILLTSALYIYVDGVTGFGRRLWITATSFAMAFTLWISIHALNHPNVVAYELPRIFMFLGAGLFIAILTARFMPCAKDLQPSSSDRRTTHA